MNKYEELKNKIDEEIKSTKEHELKLNELKEEVKKAEQEEKCSNKMPFEIGEDYYYISTAGEIAFDEWDNDEIDMWRFNQGNAFKTGQEAEDKLFQLKVEAKAREFIRASNCTVTEEEFERDEDNEYGIYYDIKENCIDYYIASKVEVNKLGYFNSEEMITKFMEENEEDLLKYFEIELKLNK